MKRKHLSHTATWFVNSFKLTHLSGSQFMKSEINETARLFFTLCR